MADEHAEILSSASEKLRWRDAPEIAAKRREIAALEEQRQAAAAAGDTGSCNRLVTKINELYDELGISGWRGFES